MNLLKISRNNFPPFLALLHTPGDTALSVLAAGGDQKKWRMPISMVVFTPK
jgi:hypothetical protein